MHDCLDEYRKIRNLHKVLDSALTWADTPDGTVKYKWPPERLPATGGQGQPYTIRKEGHPIMETTSTPRVYTDKELEDIIERAEERLALQQVHAKLDHLDTLVADLRSVALDLA